MTLIPSLEAYCQCSVTKKDTEISFVYLTTNEKIYTDPRFEDGVFSLFLNMEFYRRKDDANKVMFYMNVLECVGYTRTEIIPRKLILKLSNDETIILESEELTYPELGNGVNSYLSSFKVTMSDIQKLKANLLTSFTVQDSRTGVSKTVVPYSGFIKEQVNCLINKANN